jgi:hypothetical protein
MSKLLCILRDNYSQYEKEGYELLLPPSYLAKSEFVTKSQNPNIKDYSFLFIDDRLSKKIIYHRQTNLPIIRLVNECLEINDLSSNNTCFVLGKNCPEPILLLHEIIDNNKENNNIITYSNYNEMMIDIAIKNVKKCKLIDQKNISIFNSLLRNLEIPEIKEDGLFMKVDELIKRNNLLINKTKQLIEEIINKSINNNIQIYNGFETYQGMIITNSDEWRNLITIPIRNSTCSILSFDIIITEQNIEEKSSVIQCSLCVRRTKNHLTYSDWIQFLINDQFGIQKKIIVPDATLDKNSITIRVNGLSGMKLLWTCYALKKEGYFTLTKI